MGAAWYSTQRAPMFANGLARHGPIGREKFWGHGSTWWVKPKNTIELLGVFPLPFAGVEKSGNMGGAWHAKVLRSW